jgi:hypothetical protein
LAITSTTNQPGSFFVTTIAVFGALVEPRLFAEDETIGDSLSKASKRGEFKHCSADNLSSGLSTSIVVFNRVVTAEATSAEGHLMKDEGRRGALVVTFLTTVLLLSRRALISSDVFP